jgi:hypothetical protein
MFKVGDSCVITNVLRGNRAGPSPVATVNPLYEKLLGKEVTVVGLELPDGTIKVSVNRGYSESVFPWRLSLDMLEANE